MTDKDKRADLIARTPGAQPRDAAHASIKARREQLLSTTAAAPPDPAAPEPMPDIDTQAYARDFYARLINKDADASKPPPRGRPRLVVDNDDDPPKTS